MSTVPIEKSGGSAFPVEPRDSPWDGLTKRDYFAIMALQGLLVENRLGWKQNIDIAYQVADAMIERRDY